MPREDFLKETGRARFLRDDEPMALSNTAKALKGAGWTLGYVGDRVARYMLTPAALSAWGDDPVFRARMRAMLSKDEPLAAGDILQQTRGMHTDESDSLLERFGKGSLRFGASVVGDPLSYISLGGTTNLGKTATQITKAKQVGQAVKLGSKVSKRAAAVKGVRESPNLIRTFDKSMEGLPLAQQIEKGHRSLASIDIPFTDINIPLVTGKLASKAAIPFSAISRSGLGQRISNTARELFSTHSNNPQFDSMVSKFRDLAMHRAGEIVEDSKVLNTKMKDLTRQLGLPREVVNRMVTNVVERETAGTGARGIAQVSKIVKKTITKNKGFTTLYRAESTLPPKLPEWVSQNLKGSEQEKAAGRWFTDDLEKLEWYKKDIGPHHRIIKKTIPTSEAERWRVSNLPEGHPARGYTADPSNEFFLPKRVQEYRPSVPPRKRKLVEASDVLRMSHEEIEKAFSEADKYDRSASEEIFGKEGGKRYELLQRKANGSGPGADEAYAELQKLERDLTPEQNKRLFGIGDEGLVSEDLGNIRSVSADYHPDLLSQETPEHLSELIGRAFLVPHPSGELATQLRIKRLMEEMGSRGISQSEMMQAVENFAKSRRIDPDDARVLFQGIVRRIKEASKPKASIKQIEGLVEKFRREEVAEYRPTVPPGAPTEVWKLAKEISEKQQRQLMIEQTSGVSVLPVTADREYITHASTNEARKLIYDEAIKKGQFGVKNQKEFNEHLINSTRREFVTIKPEAVEQFVSDGILSKKNAKQLLNKDKGRAFKSLDDLLEKDVISEDQYSQLVHSLGVDEVNSLAREGKLAITGFKPVDEFFHSDPVYSTTIRGVRGEKARTAAEFFQEMKFRELALPEGQAPSHWLPVRQTELEGHVVPPEVAKALNRWNRFDTSPAEYKKFLQTYDQVQNWWKAWTLAIFPAYHTRNFVGNMWNNSLAGVTPRAYKLATEALQFKKNIEFVDGLGKKWTSESVKKAAKESGVMDRGWVGADIERTIAQQISNGTWKPTSENKLIKLGFKVGKAIENNARMAHFIHRLIAGDTPEAASLSVKKFLFDYGDLSDFERRAMKRIFPFYTWTRKNVPLQLQYLINRPAMFSIPYKAKKEIEAGVPQGQQKYLPQWMVENFPNRIRYNKKAGTYEYFLLNSWLPAADLVKVIDLHDLAVNMLTPIPKEIIQQLFNYDFFTKKKIEKIPGAKDTFLGAELPSRVVHGAKVIRLLNEVDKMTKRDTDLVSKVMGIMTGKTYPYDPMQGVIYNKSRVDDDIQTLQNAIRKEASKPRPNQKEIDRIIKLIELKAEEY